MEAKEKAKELVNKYYLNQFTLGNKKLILGILNSKQCALIAVDEIIETLKEIDKYDHIPKGCFDDWKEVKEEINKL